MMIVKYDQSMSYKKNTYLGKIYCELIFCHKNMSSNVDATLQNLCTKSTKVSNSSNLVTSQKYFIALSSQDEKLLPILQDLQSKTQGTRKRIRFCSYPEKINESELRKDFEEFCRRIRIKCHFRNDVTPQFSEILIFPPKSR